MSRKSKYNLGKQVFGEIQSKFYFEEDDYWSYKVLRNHHHFAFWYAEEELELLEKSLKESKQ